MPDMRTTNATDLDNEDANNTEQQHTYCEASDPIQQHMTYCKQNNDNAFLHDGAACVHPTLIFG
jgi:hypothetical protein